jgi:hypothetical protein
MRKGQKAPPHGYAGNLELGIKPTKIYTCWQGMKSRCENPNAHGYDRYGGRGIKVCERWQDFRNFLEDMGEPPTPQHTIDRVDNEKGYCKENCRWSTPKEQQQNKRNNNLLTHLGKTQTIRQWCDELGLVFNTVRSRLIRGRPIEEILAPTPGHKKNERRMTLHGRTQTMHDWCKEIGITYDALKARLRNGWSVERALTEPLVPKSKFAV